MSIFSPCLGANGDGYNTIDTEYASPEVSAANIASTHRLIAAQMGVDPSNMDLATRSIYDKAFATVILKYPHDFTQQEVVNAQYAMSKNFGSLQDDSFNWGEFGNAFIDNAVAAGGKVADIGTGALDLISSAGKAIGTVGKAVENTANVGKYVLPVVLIGAVAFVIASRAKQAGR